MKNSCVWWHFQHLADHLCLDRLGDPNLLQAPANESDRNAKWSLIDAYLSSG
ncbi:hypothetical protein P368_07135 [Comamonas thiooxydans]|nr:hypothetical protein P365_07610 [Comamonas thiooxydans]KGH14240.1 hypothetical protein P368_07135 [Comamonas thiooxydans]